MSNTLGTVGAPFFGTHDHDHQQEGITVGTEYDPFLVAAEFPYPVTDDPADITGTGTNGKTDTPFLFSFTTAPPAGDFGTDFGADFGHGAPGPAPAPPVNTLAPAVTGSGNLGSPLSVTPGAWTGEPAPTVTRQWYNGANPIAGETGMSYTPTIHDTRDRIKCRETATNASGTVTADSNLVTVEDVPIIGITVDNYASQFARAYWNQSANPTIPLLDGSYHYIKLLLALTANPGGEVVPDTAALAALGGAAWFDNNGTLGKFKVEVDGHDVTAAEMAAAIDAEALIEVKFVDPDMMIKAAY